jgi:hypothetical protein
MPKQMAALPLLVVAIYMTGEEVELGPVHFTVLRLVALVGVLRVLSRHEGLSGGTRTADRWMVFWGMWLAASSVFHKDFGTTLAYRLGLTFDHLALYFLLRVFIGSFEDFRQISRKVLLLLAPMAVLMLIEKLTGHNTFALLGGVSEVSATRHGKIRAQGPFAHAILAGTVGATCLPLALLFWRNNRKVALIGGIAALMIVYASGSSGPIMTALTVLLAIAVWKIRWQMKALRWGALAMIVLLSMVMQDPFYYLIARIDITGGSTGWHRAELIHAAVTHVGEWWVGGTDYTRHWMPTGVEWNTNHTDITNHYIKMGVWGGLLLVVLFVGILVKSFSLVGKVLRSDALVGNERFEMWILGAILFGHATTFVSVTYYDQSLVFFYLVLASIVSIEADVSERTNQDTAEQEVPDPALAAPAGI